jgi:rSAM/selenodomain-associated transferase 1
MPARGGTQAGAQVGTKADVQIAVLARAAVPGAAKTRLIPALGATGAAALQAHLTRLALQRACTLGVAVVLWLDGDPDDELLPLVRSLGVELRSQPPGDLGTRMLAALHGASDAGCAGLVIGTDCPAQRSEDLARAAALLRDHAVVLQPAHDGGYVLIGMRQPEPRLFTAMPWGSDAVLATTRARLRDAGLTWAELRPLPDVDRPDDVAQAVRAGWLPQGAWG